MLAKAERAEVDEIGRRLEQGLSTISREGQRTTVSMRQQLEKLHMLLNFKMDATAAQAKMHNEKLELDNRLAKMEGGVKIDQNTLRKQLGKIVEKINKLVGDVVGEREIPERQIVVPVCYLAVDVFPFLTSVASNRTLLGEIHSMFCMRHDWT